MTFRSELLASAQKTVDGDRDKEFGDPLENMKCAAQLIGDYLDRELSPDDVAIIMCLFKIARIKGNRGSKDSYRDLAGYAAIAFDVEFRSRYDRQHKEKRPTPKKRGRPAKKSL